MGRHVAQQQIGTQWVARALWIPIATGAVWAGNASVKLLDRLIQVY
jgi:hypothetical protein